jgi:hypothetical protein
MPLLRDFGTVVALDVLFALASTLILLLPLLVSTTGAMSTAAGPQTGWGVSRLSPARPPGSHAMPRGRCTAGSSPARASPWWYP